MRWLLLSALLGSLAIGSANAAEEPDADSLAATDVGVTPPTMAAGDQVVDTLAIAEGGATPLAAASTSLASRVLVVYNANVPASLNVANYYAAQRGIPASNLLGIRPSSTMGFLDNYHYSKALTEVIAPITNALTQLGQQQILYIVFTYGTPYGVWNDVWTYPSGASLRGASLDAYVCDPFGDAAKGPNVGTSQSTTFFANPYSPGQAGTPLAVAGGINGPVNAVDVNGNPVVVNTVVTYTPFESLAAFRARTGKRIYSVFRLDAANSTIAKAQVDKALQAEQAGGLDFMGGKFYFDRRNPDSLLQTPPPTGAWIYDRWVEWTLFRTKQMAMNVTLPWLQESTFWRIGEPGSNIPTAPNAAYYAGTYGWYNTIGVNGNARPDPWTWLPGAIGMEWKSEGLYGGPRGDNNPPSGTDPNIGWGVGAIAAGITAVTGCITEPYDGGVPRPDAILRNLFEGASIGDAFFRDNWWVGWQQINVGDPLYTPFPGGRPPFKPATGTQLLTIASVNPASGVSVTASPNDNNGQGTGTTQFTRTYNNNQVVNLVAPSTAGGNIFSKWQRDGVDWSTVPATSVTMDLNHTMTAIYLTPTWTLTVASSNPNSGVSVTVNPNDNNAQGNGNTQFTRTYNNNAVVNLTAPASSGGNIFSKWQRDGVDWSTVPATSVTMDLNHTMTAIYVLPTWILTVASSNPNSGVSVTVSPNDNNAQGNGVTQFTRTYNNNVVVNLTAPAIAGGNNFVKWQRDGVDWATTAATSVTMDANHTMAAIYAAPSGTTDFVTGTTPGTLRNDFSGFAGMKITVGISPVTVTDLGRYKFSGNTGTHLVKLVNVATGVDVAGVSALVNLGTGASGQFNYASLATPVMLPANTSYYLVAQETAGGDQLASFNTIVTATSVAAVNGSVNQSGTSWIFRATANTTIGPVSFKYSTGALNLPPSVSLTAPANSATFTAGTNIPINATATDSDGSVSKVDFFANNTLIGTATAGVGNVYSITWNNVVANNYALTAVATDNLNANTTSSPVNITVNPAIDPTLVGYWKLDDASGLSAVDSSGNGNTGALVNGPVWSAGATSGALSFDGVDSYVDLGNGANLNPATAITLVAWVKANSTAATSGLIIKDNGTSHQYALWLQLGGKVRLSIGAAVLTGTTTVTTGAWHQLAGTYDGTQLKIYLDGALEGTLAASGTMSNNGVNARLGGRQYPANPLTLNGALDAARIYNRALSQSEIQALTP